MGIRFIAYLLYVYIRTTANKCQYISQLFSKQVSKQVEYQKIEVKYMPVEEKLEEAKKQVESSIKMALLKKNMSQAQLADLLGENRTRINLAIKGNTNPKSIEIRKKIYKVLGME